MPSFKQLASLVVVASFCSASAACLLVLDDDCGTNAYRHHHVCYCQDGYIGDPYDACELGSALMTFELIDQCNDNLSVSWRLLTSDGAWQWPEKGTYVSQGLGVLTTQDIECAYGETICFGAASGTQVWGCGLDQPTCSGKCFSCADVTIDLGALECL